MRLVLPVGDSGAEADLDDLYGAPRPTVPGRPWAAVSMIASLDGSTVVEGRSGPLGNDGDRAVFAALRRAAAAILVGATTARRERYGAPNCAGQRIGVVTSTGDVDTSTDLFASGAGFVVMPEDGPPAPAGVDVVRAGLGHVDLAVALRRLDTVMNPLAFVQVEGGSRLNASLLEAGCVDELNLTTAPLLVGGDGPRVISGAGAATQGMRLAHLGVDDESYVFSRWVRTA